jgi:hypothetical protein
LVWQAIYINSWLTINLKLSTVAWTI